jgi:hypothetical protein
MTMYIGDSQRRIRQSKKLSAKLILAIHSRRCAYIKNNNNNNNNNNNKIYFKLVELLERLRDSYRVITEKTPYETVRQSKMMSLQYIFFFITFSYKFF